MTSVSASPGRIVPASCVLIIEISPHSAAAPVPGGQPRHQTRSGHLDLFTGCQDLHRDRVAREFVAPDHDGECRAGFVRGFPLCLHRTAAVGAVDRETLRSERFHQRPYGDHTPIVEPVDHEDLDARHGHRRAERVQREHDPFQPGAEPDAGCRRTAELLGQPVVATATAHRVLRRVERGALKLERGARVVVEAAHEPRRELHVDRQRLEPRLDALEMIRRGVRQVLRELRRAQDDVLPRLDLGIEHPHRVRVDARQELVAERAAVANEVISQGRDETRARLRIAHRVEQQAHIAEAEVTIEAGQQRDDFHIDLGILDAERLDAQLPVLAVTTFLGPLVPEVRSDVPNLPRRSRPVLHERAHHRRGAFGTEREAPTALVRELVHLLRHDVGVLTDPLEHLDVFEHRRDREAVAVPASAVGEAGNDLHPLPEIGRQDIVNPFRGAKEFVARH